MAGPKSILVLGAGELGMAVLRGLAEHRQRESSTITVLLRLGAINSTDPQKQAQRSELQSLGISTIAGDVVTASVSELASLCEPFTMVISCTGMVAGPGLQIKLTQAILKAGIKRYIPWQFGVDYDTIGRDSAQDLFSEQLDVRDLLRGQTKTEWIIVSTGMFMSFLFEESFGVVDADRKVVRALGSWQNRVTVTAVEDIGKMTAEVVFGEPKIKNEVIFIVGDTVTYDRFASVLEQCLGRSVERVEWTIDVLNGELQKDTNNTLKKYRIVFAEGRGVAWDKEESFNGKRGLEMIDLETWVKLNLL